MKRMILIQQEITKENFEVLRRFVNAVLQVIVICPDQRITKIPGILSKNIVTSKPNMRRYLMKNTAVILVFPSPKTWIFVHSISPRCCFCPCYKSTAFTGPVY